MTPNNGPAMTLRKTGPGMANDCRLLERGIQDIEVDPDDRYHCRVLLVVLEDDVQHLAQVLRRAGEADQHLPLRSRHSGITLSTQVSKCRLGRIL